MTAPGEHSVTFTTKELLSRIETKIDRMDEKLDAKADQVALTDLQNRVIILERDIVRRQGPIIDDIRQQAVAIQQMRETVLKLQDGVGSQIAAAIKEASASAQMAADRSWTKREKLLMVGFALVGALGTLISVIILVFQTLGGPVSPGEIPYP